MVAMAFFRVMRKIIMQPKNETVLVCLRQKTEAGMRLLSVV